MNMSAVLDRFVPRAARGDARLAARARGAARALLSIAAMVSILCAAYLVVRSDATAIELSIFAAGIATPVLAAIAIRFGGDAVVILVMTNVAGLAYLATWALSTGGTLSMGVPWLIGLLATLGVFGNLRVLLVTFVADAVVLAVLYAATARGWLLPSAVAPEEALALAFFGQISALAIIAASAVIVIRARARARTLIRQSEQRLRSILDGVPAVVGCLTREGELWRYVFVNRQFAARFGKSPEDVVGMSIADLIGRSAYEGLVPILRRVVAGETVEYDRSFIMPDGSTRVDRAHVVPERGADGRVQGAYLFGIDDTGRKRALDALKESQARLAEAQTMAQVGNWEYDLASDRLEWSDEVYRIFGFAVGAIEPHFRTDYLSLTHPDDRQMLLEALARVLATREPHTIDHRLVTADGTQRVVEVRAQILRLDQHGEVARLAGVVQDISVRKRTEAELISARDAAQAASRTKSAFLANMSHEIRTPMNGVLGMAELLSQEPLGAKGRKYVETIQRSGQALLGVLSDVLDLSKIEAGRMELVSARFDLGSLVREMQDLYGETAQARGVAFAVEIAPGLAQWVTGDAVRLRQVLLNLVSNAVKFTAQGRIDLRVRAEGAQLVRFEVQDSGIGIAASKHAAIFEAFAQADDGSTRRYGGTGLGLAIAREIVALMGGEIGIESVPAKGSLFWFRVPLPPAASFSSQVPEQATAADGAGLVGRRVLVAEDDGVNAEVTQAMLQRLGIAVEMTGDGAQVVAAHAAASFDLVLMDCQMPVMDGFEATRLIRATEAARGVPATPIVALTAHAFAGYREQCLAAGMDDYLVKPYQVAAFDTMLRRWLTDPGARRK